jgi:IS66 C-terminal element
MLTLIHTAKLNHVDPQAWFADLPRSHRRSRHPQARSVAAMELEA